MVGLLLAAALQTVPVERIADDVSTHLAIITLASAADFASTGYGLKQCPTCQEGNVLGPNAEARLSLQIAADATVGLTVYKLERWGHHKGARWATITFAAVKAVFVGINLRHAWAHK